MCGSLMDSGLCDAAGAIVDLRRGRLPPPAAAQSDRSAVPDPPVLPRIRDGRTRLRASVRPSGQPYEVPENRAGGAPGGERGCQTARLQVVAGTCIQKIKKIKILKQTT